LPASTTAPARPSSRCTKYFETRVFVERGPSGSGRELLARFSERGPSGSGRELLYIARFSGDRRLFDIPEIGVRARSLPNLGRTGLSRWLDDCAFSFPAPGIT
jgi:hypothetical protein